MLKFLICLILAPIALISFGFLVALLVAFIQDIINMIGDDDE